MAKTLERSARRRFRIKATSTDTVSAASSDHPAIDIPHAPDTLISATPDPIERIGFAVGADGVILADKLRASTQAKLAKAFSTPEARALIGVAGSSNGTSAGAVFDASIYGHLYKALSGATVQLGVRLGAPVHVAMKWMPFTDDETQLLATQTAATVDQYFPDGLGKHQNLIMLVTSIGAMLVGKVEAMRQDMAGARSAAAEVARAASVQ